MLTLVFVALGVAVAIYFISKNYLFERLLQRHFVFDPLVLRTLIKKAVDAAPEDEKSAPHNVKLKPAAVIFGTDGWYKLPESDGRPILERHEKVLEARCAGLIAELAKHYGKKYIHNNDHDFMNSITNEEKWLFVIVGSGNLHNLYD
jgi:hypothetical protein